MLCYLFIEEESLKPPFLYSQAKLIFIHLFIRQSHDLSGKEGKCMVPSFQELSLCREVIMYLRRKSKNVSLVDRHFSPLCRQCIQVCSGYLYFIAYEYTLKILKKQI